MSRFTQILLVSPLDDGKTWVLMRDFGYEVGSVGSGDFIDVPIGFMTDFASVPWFAQWWIPKWGKYGNAAVIHDWLYWSHGRTKETSDRILLEAMAVMGVGEIRKYAIYVAVRLFGWWAWRRNQEDRDSGFDRVLLDLDLKSGAKSLRQGSFRQMLSVVYRKVSRRRKRRDKK